LILPPGARQSRPSVGTLGQPAEYHLPISINAEGNSGRPSRRPTRCSWQQGSATDLCSRLDKSKLGQSRYAVIKPNLFDDLAVLEL
jgi:hypothetical protein